jgi:hypothetical protein
MSEQFRTVASFDAAYKADIVKAALEDAGIPAVVTDREIVAMDWLLTNAVQGVKVQVPDDRMGEAAAFIRELERKGATDRPVSDEELERQALEAAPADDEPPPPEEEVTAAPPADANDPTALDRDQYARRFMLSSVFSLVFPPLLLFAVYYGLVAVFGAGRMTSVGWQRVGFGVAFGGLWMVLAFWLGTVVFSS